MLNWPLGEWHPIIIIINSCGHWLLGCCHLNLDCWNCNFCLFQLYIYRLYRLYIGILFAMCHCSDLFLIFREMCCVLRCKIQRCIKLISIFRKTSWIRGSFSRFIYFFPSAIGHIGLIDRAYFIDDSVHNNIPIFYIFRAM